MSAFKIKVQTDNTGTSNDDQFTIPGKAGVTNNYTVSGSFTGSPLTITDTNDHTLTFPGGADEYELSFTEEVSGGMPTIYFNNEKDCQKVTELSQWGTNKFATFEKSFYGCINMTITATDHATADTDEVTDWSQMLRGCTSVTSFPLLDTSAATTFNLICYQCTSMTSFSLVDSSNVLDCAQAWRNSGLTSFPLLNLSSCTTMYRSFMGCTGLNNYDFPTITVLNCTNFVDIFNGVTLSTMSYTNILEYLAANNLNTSVTFHGGSSKYYHVASDDHTTLDTTRSWSITDGGLETEAFGTLSCTPDTGKIGDTITINNTGSGFYDTMVVKCNDVTGASLNNITVVDYNQLTADISSGFVGPDIYVVNSDIPDSDTIADAFVLIKNSIENTKLKNSIMIGI